MKGTYTRFITKVVVPLCLVGLVLKLCACATANCGMFREPGLVANCDAEQWRFSVKVGA